MEMRLKMLPKDEIILKSGEFIKKWIFVSQGKLRVDRDIVMEYSNYWPGNKADSNFLTREDMDAKVRKKTTTWI